MVVVGAPWRHHGDSPERGKEEGETGTAGGAAWGGGAMGMSGGARPCCSGCSLYVEVLQRSVRERKLEGGRRKEKKKKRKEKKRKIWKIFQT
jgi:hypothetical protein